MKNQFIMLMLVFASLGAYAQHDHSTHASQAKDQGTPEFKDEKTGKAYTHYIHLKDALVSSNADKAKKAATELAEALSTVSDGSKAASEANKIASSTDISEQRKYFSSLSNEMTVLVKANKLASGSLYVEYCPMANNNKGAYWLSNEKEIKNPYFGDMMLKCGTVKETLQ